jgi:hypothetical protein
VKPSLSACSTRASRSARKSTFCTSGALPGKTIVFAMSKDHAGRIREVFEEMFPQYSQNNGATISWPVEHLLEEFDMTRRPLLSCRGAILLAACRAEPTFNSPCRRSQTLRRDAALVSHPKEQATRPRVLKWVISRRFHDVRVISALPSNSDIARCSRHVSKVPQAYGKLLERSTIRNRAP